MASIIINEAELRNLLAGNKGAVWQDINRRGNRVLNGAISACPYDKGTLRQSLTKEMLTEDGMPVARIGTNIEYAIFVHEGVGLYGPKKRMIVPVNFTVLKWAATNNSGTGRRRYKGGKTAAYVYSKRSRGFKGTPFLRDSLKYAQ